MAMALAMSSSPTGDPIDTSNLSGDAAAESPTGDAGKLGGKATPEVTAGLGRVPAWFANKAGLHKAPAELSEGLIPIASSAIGGLMPIESSGSASRGASM